MKKILKNNWKLYLIASLTLGLVPFREPHILGKIKWILGGNAFSGEHPMKGQDWFDFIMHGTPWLLLFVSIVINIFVKLAKNDQE